MNTFTRFLYEFLNQFFSGVLIMFKGIGNGIKDIFDITAYQKILDIYKDDLTLPEWALIIIVMLLILLLIGMIIFLIYLLFRKYFKFRKKAIKQDELMEEIATLNGKIAKLVKEKENILAMKVSQLGLKPGENSTEEVSDSEEKDDVANNPNCRFSKLALIDQEYANYKSKDYGNTFTLPELCESFRNFAASKLGLFYKPEMMRIFISGLASTKLVILQGISGTGKTSLA